MVGFFLEAYLPVLMLKLYINPLKAFLFKINLIFTKINLSLNFAIIPNLILLYVRV